MSTSPILYPFAPHFLTLEVCNAVIAATDVPDRSTARYAGKSIGMIRTHVCKAIGHDYTDKAFRTILNHLEAIGRVRSETEDGKKRWFCDGAALTLADVKTDAPADTKAAQQAEDEESTGAAPVSNSESTARATLQGIVEMVQALDACAEDDYEAKEKACADIQNDPLEIQVRDGWRSLGDTNSGMDNDGSRAEEFYILLSTGGPAVRIYGKLDNGTPKDVEMQHQDWGTPWQSLRGYSDAEVNALDTYVAQFCFEE